MAGTFDSPIGVSSLGQTDSGAGSALDTGDLRRTYAFGSQAIAEISPDQTPFFKFANMFSYLPTSDPQYKYTEARASWHKRYAYVTGWKAYTSGAVPTSGYTTNSSDVSSLTPQTTDSVMALKLETDYKSSGNIQNIYGNSNNAIAVGASGTRPKFILPNQLLKINTKSSATGYTNDDYFIVRVLDTATSGEIVYVTAKVVRALNTASNKYLCSFTAADTPIANTYTYAQGTFASSTEVPLEHMRTYVVGTAFLPGSGLPDTWKDDPYTTTYGQTQIWKTTLSMDNSARTTVTKIVPNEFARLWELKLLEHKWDINYDCLFGARHTDDDNYQYTQGAVDYLLNNCTTFSLDTSTKTIDGFLHDMSVVADPRYGSSNGMIYFCNTEVYHWMNTLSGFAANNLALGDVGTAGSAGMVNHYNFQLQWQKPMFGIDISKVRTIYGDMYLAREVALDGSPVQMMGINMNYIKWRPLVGNGINRDTAVYAGVQTLENSGIDARVDLILTEGGMQYNVPEAHAIWVK